VTGLCPISIQVAEDEVLQAGGLGAEDVENSVLAGGVGVYHQSGENVCRRHNKAEADMGYAALCRGPAPFFVLKQGTNAQSHSKLGERLTDFRKSSETFPF
jgi:hypothetical protein